MREQMDKIQRQVLEKMDVSRDITDAEIAQLIDAEMKEEPECQILSLAERELFTKTVYNSLRRLDVLQELIEDELVTEIMVNGASHIFYRRKVEF